MSQEDALPGRAQDGPTLGQNAPAAKGQPHRPSVRRDRGPLAEWGRAHLGHVDGAGRQRFVAQDGSVFVALSPLQHDLELVAFSLQEVRVLQRRGVTAAICPSGHASPAPTSLRLTPRWAVVGLCLGHRESRCGQT